MFTLTERKTRRGNSLKTMIVYLGVSAFCLAFDFIYSLYGHGVRSASMSLMFLYPLLGGAAVFLLLLLFSPPPGGIPRYRLLYNLYNSGIAALVVGAALRGVFEIAGTSSPYTVIFTAAGALFVGIGVVGFWRGVKNRHPYIRHISRMY